MTDEIDRACEAEEWFRSQALDNRQVMADAMPFTGQCYNCELTIDSGSFCDVDCRDDYDLREKQNKQRV
jgi:hypothetical protein